MEETNTEADIQLAAMPNSQNSGLINPKSLHDIVRYILNQLIEIY